MNFGVVKGIVEYARSIEKEHNKNFRFTITTNGVYCLMMKLWITLTRICTMLFSVLMVVRKLTTECPRLNPIAKFLLSRLLVFRAQKV